MVEIVQTFIHWYYIRGSRVFITHIARKMQTRALPGTIFICCVAITTVLYETRLSKQIKLAIEYR